MSSRRYHRHALTEARGYAKNFDVSVEYLMRRALSWLGVSVV